MSKIISPNLFLGHFAVRSQGDQDCNLYPFSLDFQFLQKDRQNLIDGSWSGDIVHDDQKFFPAAEQL